MRGFWARSTDCIVDVRVTDTDAKSYRNKTPAKVLAMQEEEKKRKYSQACREQRRHFVPFVVSADGLLGKEAKALLTRLAMKIAHKWDRPYSQICGYVRSRISIAVARATHLCLRGSRTPTSRMSLQRQAQFEDGAGIGLLRWSDGND